MIVMQLCLFLPQTPRSYPLTFWIQHPFKSFVVMDQYLHWQHWGWCRYLYFLDLQPQVFTPTACCQVYHIIVLLYRCLICRGIVVEIVENNFFSPIWQEVNIKHKDKRSCRDLSTTSEFLATVQTETYENRWYCARILHEFHSENQ